MNVGTAGENLAINYLQNKGYVILEKNYRFGHNEIDIICEKKGVVVFVEVKTRTTDEFGAPIETIDRSKVNKITDTAEAYLCKRNLFGKCKSRFDVIGITKDNIEHIEDAFRE